MDDLENEKNNPMKSRPMPRLLSFVFPVFNEAAVLPLLRERIQALTGAFPCPIEMVFVDDGSRDATLAFLESWGLKDRRVKVLSFSRNFGHQAAITAGIDHAVGDVIVTLDADLQDPPELILEMLELYTQGYDVIYAQRSRRDGETIFKKVTAAVFYRLMKTFVQEDLPPDSGDFRMISRPVADAFCQLNEGHRFFRGLVTWLGFCHIGVTYERQARAAGETKYPLWKMIRFASDAILSFSTMPLRLASFAGIITFLFGVGMMFYALIRKFVWDDLVPGWPTLVILECLIGGILLISVGLLGEYVGRLYEEIKARPLYIIRDAFNMNPRLIVGSMSSRRISPWLNQKSAPTVLRTIERENEPHPTR